MLKNIIIIKICIIKMLLHIDFANSFKILILLVLSLFSFIWLLLKKEMEKEIEAYFL